jgi:hypothetical protein
LSARARAPPLKEIDADNEMRIGSCQTLSLRRTSNMSIYTKKEIDADNEMRIVEMSVAVLKRT